MKNERIFDMPVSNVYPLYLKKVEKKGRTEDELTEVINWLNWQHFSVQKL